jgi:integral membrane protein
MNLLKIFRIIAFLEGVSYLLLFVVSMPLKYLYDMPEPNQVIGMFHGVLFIAYCILSIIIYKEYSWSKKTLALVLLASLLPFATFIAEYKLFNKMEKNDK